MSKRDHKVTNLYKNYHLVNGYGYISMSLTCLALINGVSADRFSLQNF